MRLRIIPQDAETNWYVIDKMIGPDKMPAVGFRSRRGEHKEPLRAFLLEADSKEKPHRSRAP